MVRVIQWNTSRVNSLMSGIKKYEDNTIKINPRRGFKMSKPKFIIMSASEDLSVSVIIPSKGGEYLEHTLKSLANQSIKPHEVILVLKNCDMIKFEALCEKLKLNCIIEEQKEGYVTQAMNIGKKIADCEILIFTDEIM